MLGRDDHGINAKRLAVGVILHGDLAFAIGTKVAELSGFPDLRQASGQLVGQGNGKRHQFRGFVGCIAEHHALIAGAARIHAHGNVARLLVDGRNHGAGVGVEAIDRVVISDGGDHAAHQRLKIDVGASTDFSRNHHQTGCGQRFAGDPAMRVLIQTGVQNRVGDLVGNLVGMSFCYRFRSK